MIVETSAANGHSLERKHLIAVTTGVLSFWTAMVVALAIQGVFDFPPGAPPIATILAVVIPIAAFATIVTVFPGMRASLLSLDPVLLTEFQAWRILGGLFLAVYAFGHLPGLFAWPAGIGDVAVGVTAPFIAWRLRKEPEFITSPKFRVFQYAGLLDFVIAISMGVIARNEISGLVGDVTSAPMGEIPLVLIPTLVVPMFIILHLIALMQSRTAR